MSFFGADFTVDVYIDSKITLIQDAGSGSYRTYSITLVTQNLETIHTIEQNGTQSATTVPYEECYTPWQYLLERDIGNLPNAPLQNFRPDHSTLC